MPIYEYRCECGEKVEALVRSGREPTTGDEIGHFCDTSGKLVKLLSGFAVGHSSGGFGGGEAFAGPSCDGSGTCGSCGAPDSCQFD
jgi:predicted nucleic acid-binding Zn ribbon protein